MLISDAVKICSTSARYDTDNCLMWHDKPVSDKRYQEMYDISYDRIMTKIINQERKYSK